MRARDGGSEFVSGELKSLRVKPEILIHDLPSRGGSFIGASENYFEQRSSIGSSRRLLSDGYVNPPPISTAKPSGSVKIIAHFYNDFGLQYHIIGKGGDPIWYDWSWNHHDAEDMGYPPYDASRHPLLGFYRGDEVNVLDWQMYWLREYGISAVTPLAWNIDFETWNLPANRNYWLYQLYNNVPNFKGLKYVLTPYFEGDPDSILKDWHNQFNYILRLHNNALTLRIRGKFCVAFFIFDGELLRVTLGGTPQLRRFLADRAAELKSFGYDGLALIVRNPTGDGLADFSYAKLEEDDVFYFPGGYEFLKQFSPDAKTYKELVCNYVSPQDQRTIPSIATSAVTRLPLNSGWNYTGSTPALFQLWLTETIEGVLKNNQPRLVTIYNVAEWAEGGPGLQPNRENGFGYLQAVRNALTDSTSSFKKKANSGTARLPLH